MKPTILVIDDHQLYRITLCELLRVCWPNAEIAQAADGSRALNLIVEQHWDVLLLDYQLPGISGGELIRQMRARAAARDTPFPALIMMSTQPDVPHFIRAFGAAGFLPKPVDADQLYELVAAHLPEAAAGQPDALDDRMVDQERQADGAAASQPAPEASAGDGMRRQPMLSARIDRIQTTILDILHDSVSRFPPPYVSGTLAHPPGRAPRLGEYLVQLGYLAPWQLTRALHTSETLTSRGRAPLGFGLVVDDLVQPEVLSAVLLQQFRERLELNATTAPRFLGEKLLLQAKLTPEQLALALCEQLDSYRFGKWMRLGDVIVSQGWLDSVTIKSVVAGTTLPRQYEEWLHTREW